MSDERPPDKLGALAGEVHASTHAQARLKSILLVGLPDKSGPESVSFYQRVMEQLPPQHFVGFYGLVINDDSVELFLNGGDKENPTLRLKMDSADFINFADAIQQIREKRFGRPT